MTVQDIYQLIDGIAPFETQLDFDNAGLLIGDRDAEVQKVLVALDVTDAVVDEAVQFGANLIVTHHPVIWAPLKSILADMLAYRLVNAGIAVISAHTNLDKANGGVNDILAAKLSLVDTRTIDEDGIVRVGELLPGMAPPEFSFYVKRRLDLGAIRYCDGGRPVETVAVCGGSGGSYLEAVKRAGAQAFVTSDIKHDVWLTASRMGVTLIDAGHFGTENPVTDYLLELVRGAVGAENAKIASANTDPSVAI